MATNTRDDFAFLLRRNERRMNAERRTFATAVVDAIRATQTREGQVFDVYAYVRIQHTLRLLYDEFYGAFPGDQRARFWRLTLDDCREARALAFQRAAQDVRRRLRTVPALIRAIREAA
jgi:hypothetical protein